jgi:hypothetical protein
MRSQLGRVFPRGDANSDERDRSSELKGAICTSQ